MKIIRSLLPIHFLAFLTLNSCVSNSQNPPFNYKQAFINKSSGSYFIITLFGQRLLMAHDLPSLVKNSSFKDSVRLLIPRSIGVLNYSEVLSAKDSFAVYSKGKIIIKNDSMNIELFYKYSDSEKDESSSWNGNYILLWKDN
jgi:hypothetical protein